MSTNATEPTPTTWATAERCLATVFQNEQDRPSVGWFHRRAEALEIPRRKLGHRTVRYDLGAVLDAFGVSAETAAGFSHPAAVFEGVDREDFEAIGDDWLVAEPAAVRILFDAAQVEQDERLCRIVAAAEVPPVGKGGGVYFLLSSLVRAQGRAMAIFDNFQGS